MCGILVLLFIVAVQMRFGGVMLWRVSNSELNGDVRIISPLSSFCFSVSSVPLWFFLLAKKRMNHRDTESTEGRKRGKRELE
jgi:hypothetical protein